MLIIIVAVVGSDLAHCDLTIVVIVHLICREQQKKLSALEMDLAAARHAGFVSKHSTEKDESHSKKKLLAVIGIITTFGRKRNREAIRKAWLPTGN